jgi:c-di-GMP-binding flagellar brake protein YcgR
MTKRPAAKKTIKKTKKAPEDLAINRRREWRFELPLGTVIAGQKADGRKFQEKTKLGNISSGGAFFCLNSGVVVGSKLNLEVELPEKLADGKKLTLRIGGITVRLEKPDLKSKRQGVAVRFSNDFQIVPAPKKK